MDGSALSLVKREREITLNAFPFPSRRSFILIYCVQFHGRIFTVPKRAADDKSLFFVIAHKHCQTKGIIIKYFGNDT